MLCNIIFQQENTLFLHILTKTTRFNTIATQFLVKLYPKHILTQNAPEADTLRGAVFYKLLRQQQSLWVYCDKNLLNLSDNQ